MANKELNCQERGEGLQQVRCEQRHRSSGQRGVVSQIEDGRIEGEQREDDKTLRDIAEFQRKTIWKSKLAVCGLVSPIHSPVQQKHHCQADSQPFTSGRELPLDRRKNGRKKRDRAENDKVRRSEKLEVGCHA